MTSNIQDVPRIDARFTCCYLTGKSVPPRGARGCEKGARGFVASGGRRLTCARLRAAPSLVSSGGRPPQRCAKGSCLSVTSYRILDRHYVLCRDEDPFSAFDAFKASDLRMKSIPLFFSHRPANSIRPGCHSS